MTPEEIAAIEIRLGYIFLDRSLLIQALTRRAAALERMQKGIMCEDQEVFSTLGDAVLKLTLTELLIQQGYTTPGSITQQRQILENEERLSTIIRAMEIIPIVGIGERSIGVHEQPRALAETFEAIVAAIYQDGGYEIIKKLVVKWFS